MKIDVMEELRWYSSKLSENSKAEAPEKADLYEILTDISKSFKSFEIISKRSVVQNEAQISSLQEDNKMLQEQCDLLKEENDQLTGYQEKLLMSIISILDQVYEIEKFAISTNNEAWIKSLEMVDKRNQKILSNVGITEIPTKGEMMDEEMHNCVESIASSMPLYCIIDVRKKGYVLNNQVILRVADVVVSNGKE